MHTYITWQGQSMYVYVLRILHNFEIVLRILSIAKLHANFEIAYAISKLFNETILCHLYWRFLSEIHQCWIAAITSLHLLNTWLGEKGRTSTEMK